jgi:hypothetical protein
VIIYDPSGPGYSDGKWHEVEVIQMNSRKCIFKVDGKSIGEHSLEQIDITTGYNDEIRIGKSALDLQ